MTILSTQSNSYCSWIYKLFRLEGQGGLLLFIYVCHSYINELYADVFSSPEQKAPGEVL